MRAAEAGKAAEGAEGAKAAAGTAGTALRAGVGTVSRMRSYLGSPAVRFPAALLRVLFGTVATVVLVTLRGTRARRRCGLLP